MNYTACGSQVGWEMLIYDIKGILHWLYNTVHDTFHAVNVSAADTFKVKHQIASLERLWNPILIVLQKSVNT